MSVDVKKRIARSCGFTTVEMIVVVLILMIVTVMGVGISRKVYQRRDTDRVIYTMASRINTMRLSAMRKGVEHRVDITYEPGCAQLEAVGEKCNFLTITTSRGDSNRGSTQFVTLDTDIVEMDPNLTVTPSSVTYTFQPRGRVEVVGGGEITVVPANEFATTVRRCGVITVSGFGRVNIVFGRWDAGSGVCQPIRDEFASPTPSS